MYHFDVAAYGEANQLAQRPKEQNQSNTFWSAWLRYLETAVVLSSYTGCKIAVEITGLPFCHNWQLAMSTLSDSPSTDLSLRFSCVFGLDIRCWTRDRFHSDLKLWLNSSFWLLHFPTLSCMRLCYNMLQHDIFLLHHSLSTINSF